MDRFQGLNSNRKSPESQDDEKPPELSKEVDEVETKKEDSSGDSDVELVVQLTLSDETKKEKEEDNISDDRTNDDIMEIYDNSCPSSPLKVRSRHFIMCSISILDLFYYYISCF